ncbi:MAG TPA: shikimate kinase [Miltoncostaeaceae bacterium]|nr:shikimate kinase [Miltoncostaeaceae bacterium]
MAWVVLTGYMGAGKSTVGRALAERLGRPLVDSDARIEQEAGLEIPRIFATKGELWFRRTEERAIRGILAEEPHGVLALGGGAVESDRTRDLLRRVAQVVWLRAPAASLWDRVAGSGRPLATDEGRFARRLERRMPRYAEVAGLTVDAEAPVEALVDEIAAWVAGRAEVAR